jgi:hypothetical protein
MRVRLLVTMTVLALVTAACTGSIAPGTPEANGRTPVEETLLLGTPGGPLLVRVPVGSVLFDGPGAVSSLGGAWVLSTAASDGSTLLETHEGSTGRILSTATISGELEARIVSESGRAVAMMEPLPAGWDPAVPFPRARTRIVVADPTGERETISLNLRGNFEPEAFSTNDDQLFLIQHLPAETPSAYRVTVLDLVREKLLPVFGPFKGPAERMPGTRLSQLLSPDADQLYTLYTSSRPGYAPHGAPVANDAAVSFVHVLSLRDGWAHCVGLPRSMWDRPSSEQAMATTPDGNYLFVIDAGRGLVAALHTESLEVRTTPIDLSGEGDIARTVAHVSPDGRTLLVSVAGAEGSVVSAFDAATFEEIDSWRLEGVVSGLDFSSDGSSVYAATEGRIVVLDVRTGLEIGAVPVPTDEPVVRVTALAG